MESVLTEEPGKRCRRCKHVIPISGYDMVKSGVSTVCRECRARNQCSACERHLRPRDFYPGATICKRCKITASSQSRAGHRERKAKGTYKPTNSPHSDRMENTWDLGTLSRREQTAYLRGIWVGWKRGLDSYSRMGPGDGNMLASFLSQVMACVDLPETLKAQMYREGRRIGKDLLVRRPVGITLEEYHGQKGKGEPGRLPG